MFGALRKRQLCLSGSFEYLRLSAPSGNGSGPLALFPGDTPYTQGSILAIRSGCRRVSGWEGTSPTGSRSHRMQFCSCGKSLTCASHFPRLPLAGGAPPHPTPSDSANVISGRFPQHLKTVRPRALPSFLPSATLEVGRGRCVPGAPTGAPCVLYAVWIPRSSLWTLGRIWFLSLWSQ